MKLEPQLGVASPSSLSTSLPNDPLAAPEPIEPIPDDITVLAEAAPAHVEEAAPPPALPPRRTTMPSTTPIVPDPQPQPQPLPAATPPSGSHGGEGLYIDILPMKLEGKQQQRLLLNPFADAFGEQETTTDE